MSERCIENIFKDWKYYRCSRAAVSDGYCKQHHPDSKAARAKKSEELYREKQANSPYAKLREAKARIAALEAERRWIPVSERLPDSAGEYIVVIQEEDHQRDVAIVMYFDDTYADESDTWRINDGFVSHWMPLPEPPENE